MRFPVFGVSMPVKSLEREKRNISIPNTDSTLSMLLLMVVTLVYSIKVSTTALTHTHKGSEQGQYRRLAEGISAGKMGHSGNQKSDHP